MYLHKQLLNIFVLLQTPKTKNTLYLPPSKLNAYHPSSNLMPHSFSQSSEHPSSFPSNDHHTTCNHANASLGDQIPSLTNALATNGGKGSMKEQRVFLSLSHVLLNILRACQKSRSKGSASAASVVV